MDVFEGVRTLLAVRDYRDEPIPDDVVARILEAARLTGSSRNQQHWDFVVIRDPATLRRLGGLARTGPYISKAPLAIAVVMPDAPIGYIDGARAAQDMMLVAWEAGVGSNWVSNLNTDEVRAMLKVPADRMILAVIPFGYPTQDLGKGIKNRKPLGEITHSEMYGQPYRLATE
jgi:nitroreductase